MLNVEQIIKYTTSLKLLYIEDNQEAREATLFILEDFFDEIIVAENGQEGLENFLAGDLDLIITDINMPRMNGLDMIREIRKVNTEVPILVLSAYNESGFFMDSIKLGVEGYLLKPIDMTQFLGMLERVTNRLKLKDELENNLHFLHQYQEAADSSSIVSKSDLNGNITYVNDAFCEISGYTREELLGHNHNIIRHPDNDINIFVDMWDTIKNKKKTWQGIVRNKKKDGGSYYVKAIIKPMLNKEGEIIEYMALRDDITNIMSPKKQLSDLVSSSKEAIVVLVKIDGFDEVEKSYGNYLSQKIEEKFSTSLLELMPNECLFDRVFTLGEGEYAFAKDKKECDLDEAVVSSHLKRLQSNVNDIELNIGDVDYDISIIVSFACGEDSLTNARYGLKKLILTNQDFILSNDLVAQEHAEAQKNLKVLKMVKKALEDFRIVSYFQPIINNRTKKIEKYESLVRLIDVDDNVIVPFYFLDAAKKGKYYHQITAMVLENSFHALSQTDMDITINISVLDIEKRLTREKIFELLHRHKTDLHRVVFELLEDENAKDFEVIKKFITDVKSLGAKIAIDDFGAGYSNFERLLDYQPDILKIDGSLIKNIESDSFSLNVVETIVNFAQKQKIKTVAEYVENENIYNILNDLGVDYSQGYYFGKPDKL
jgi:PAS domain S-box-containing protein